GARFGAEPHILMESADRLDDCCGLCDINWLWSAHGGFLSSRASAPLAYRARGVPRPSPRRSLTRLIGNGLEQRAKMLNRPAVACQRVERLQSAKALGMSESV